MSATRFVAAFAVVAAATLAGSGAASSATATTLRPTAEAWYQPNPTCATPLGCSGVAPPPVSPYPDATLHVGVSGGQETARSFIAFPLRSVTGTITAATLTLPLDTKPLSGDTSSATAHLAVCVTHDPIEPVAGSFGARPGTDCSAAANAKYVPSPQPHFTVDLAPLVDALTAATGFVVLPDSTKITPTEAWRVAFSAHDRSDADAPPAPSLSVTVGAAPVDEPAADESVFLPDLNVSLVDPLLGTGFAAAPTVVPTPRAPSILRVPGTVNAPRAIADVHYRYKVVWLLPLLLLALVPAIVRSLTKDLAPRA